MNGYKKQKEKGMKIAILGIGGVGGFYGGKLARKYEDSAEHEIFFVARGEHLQKIKTDCLMLITKDGNFIAKPSLVTDRPAELGPLDLIIISVKGYDLKSAAQMIKGNLDNNTVIIPILNGVNNVEILKTILTKGIILNGCVYISTQIVSPGVVEHVGGAGKMFFGPEEGSIEPYRKIETLLKEADINAVLSDNINVDVWSKYIFIGPLASVTSMTGLPLGAVMENKEYKAMMEGMMVEIKMIADAEGIELPENIVQKSMDLTSNFPYETKSSLQLDFERGKQAEVETFTGFVVKSGKKLGIKTPLHDAAYSALKNKQEVQ
jgi:2-dehydropantoate 2-reductase